MDSIINEIHLQRAKNLKKLIQDNYKNINTFCIQHNLDYAMVHRNANGKLAIGSITLKRYEKIFNLPRGGLSKKSGDTIQHMILVYPTNKLYSSIDDIKNAEPISSSYLDSSEFIQLKINPNKQLGIKYNNNSMSPDVKSGWHMLINTEQINIDDGEYYALLYNQRFIIRRIFFNPQSLEELILKPSNPDFETQTVKLEDIIIIGQPVYILLGKL